MTGARSQLGNHGRNHRPGGSDPIPNLTELLNADFVQRMPTIAGTAGGTLDTLGTFLSGSVINSIGFKANHVTDFDSDVYSLIHDSGSGATERFRLHINFDAYGYYLVKFGFTWYYDWNDLYVKAGDTYGGVGGGLPYFTEFSYEDTGGNEAVFPNPKYQTAASPPHTIHAVGNWGIIFKETGNSLPIEPQIYVQLTSGSNRVADASVQAKLVIVQLSTQDVVDPVL